MTATHPRLSTRARHHPWPSLALPLLLVLGIGCGGEVNPVAPPPAPAPPPPPPPTPPPASPAALVVVSGSGQTDAPGNPLGEPLVARVNDQTGTPLGGVAVSFTVIAGGGALSATSSTTNSAGQAQTAWILGPQVGEQAVEARVSGVAQPVQFQATASTELAPSQAAIGPGGGTVGVALPGGGRAHLDLSGGAVSAGTVVRIEARPPAGPELARVRLSPAGARAAAPVRLRLALPGGPRPLDIVHVRRRGISVPIPTERNGAEVSASLPFLGFSVTGGSVAFGGGDLMDAGSVAADTGVLTVEAVPDSQALTLRFIGFIQAATDWGGLDDFLLVQQALIAQTGLPAGLAALAAAICQAAETRYQLLGATPVASLQELVMILRPLSAWSAVLKGGDLTCAEPYTATRIGELAGQRTEELLAAHATALAGTAAPETFAERFTVSVDLIEHLRNDLVQLGLGQDADERLGAMLGGVVERLILVGRGICVAGRGYAPLQYLVELVTHLKLPLSVASQVHREIQLCGTDVEWRVVDADGGVRQSGRVSPADALVAIPPPIAITAKYGDQLVLSGRLDALYCVATSTTTPDVLIVTADGETRAAFPAAGTGPGAPLVPSDGRTVLFNLLADGADSGVEALERSFELALRRESNGCQGALTAGLEAEFRLLRAQVTLQPFEVTPPTLPPAEKGEEYVASLEVLNAQGTPAWQLAQGELPPGLALSPSGEISGTPEEAGTFSFDVRVEAEGAYRVVERAITVAGAVMAPVAGSQHVCGLIAPGGTWCWGRNHRGQLGTGSTTSSSIPVQVAVGQTFVHLSAGADHTCGLTASGEAWCWGRNDWGQLGDGSTTDRTVPVQVAGGRLFSSILAAKSGNTTCGLDLDGQAWCWGRNTGGQLGDGSTTSSSVPVPVASTQAFAALAGAQRTCGLTAAGAVWCWPGIQFQDFEPFLLEGGQSFTSLVGGNANVFCGLTAAGRAWCWGWNIFGALGNGGSQSLTTQVPVQVADNHTFASLAAGDTHVCGLTAGGATWCWGQNTGGIATTSNEFVFTRPVLSQGGQAFTSLWAGSNFTCGRTATGEVWCWGVNGHGQFGNGTTTSTVLPVKVTWNP